MRLEAALLLALFSCRSTPAAPSVDLLGQTGTGSVPASVESRSAVVSWKERMNQAYVCVEHVGDYRRLGDAMRALFAKARELELVADGPPFALYFDDPGRVSTDALRARACLPVAARPAVLDGLAFDLLPRAMVAYAQVGGAYPEAGRAVPALRAYLDEHGWRQVGPVREVYLVNPAETQRPEELLTEVQIPWTTGNE